MKKYMAVLLILCAALVMTACTGNNAPAPTNPTVSPDMLATPDVIPGLDETPGAGIADSDPGTTDGANGMDGANGAGGANGTDGAGGAGGTGDAGGAGGTGATGGTISGFEEGKQVNETDVPKITQAVKEKYQEATITGITMSTHAGNQVYHVMLEGAQDTTDIYVDTMGNIMPYVSGTDATVTQ